jgi:hypothetical protein
MKYKNFIWALIALLSICSLFVFLTKSGSKKNNEAINTDSAPKPHQRENKHNIEGIANIKKLVKNGDLILRNGEDFISASAREFSKTDKRYSHCGIASIENDTVYIYHSIGDPKGGGVRKDLFEEFCTYKENLSFGVYRYNFSKKIVINLDKVIKRKYAEKIKFDSDFDLATDDAEYCSEFIYKSIITASDSSVFLPIDKNLVALDNLYLNNYCKKIVSFDFINSR